MNALIKITISTIGSEETNSVNARDLWVALESKQKFADWIKDRLPNFVEGVDYTPLRRSMNRPQGGGVASLDYIITTDMAKHLCMMEHTDKGKEVRQYFIAAEKIARKPLAPTTLRDALKLALEQEEMLIAKDVTIGVLQSENATLKQLSYEATPALERYNEVLRSPSHLTIHMLAKEVRAAPYDLPEGRLREFLKGMGDLNMTLMGLDPTFRPYKYIHQDHGVWVPMDYCIKDKTMVSRQPISPSGRIGPNAMFTQKGAEHVKQAIRNVRLQILSMPTSDHITDMYGRPLTN